MKITMQLENREVDTLADLVAAELKRGKDRLGLYQRRSLVRLALKVHSLAKDNLARWAVLTRGPGWVYDYLGAPLFPEAKPKKRLRLIPLYEQRSKPPKPKHRPKGKRMARLATEPGMKPTAPPPE